jgi:hypothetical protein
LTASYLAEEKIHGSLPAGGLHENHLIAAVAHAFGTSEAAARIRLLKLKLIGSEAPPTLFNLPPAA